MDFNFNRERVIGGLQKAISIMPSKTGAASLRAIWISAKNDHVTFSATDANVEFSGVYPAEVLEEGLIGVNGQIFYSLISTCHDDIKIKYNENEGSLNILHKNGTCKLPIMETTWFQKMRPFPEENAVVISGSLLQEGIEKILFSVADDNSISCLSCMCLKKRDTFIDLCGLDGHQFALFSFEHDQLLNILPDSGILIQKNYLPLLTRWLPKDEIEFSFTEKNVFFRNKTFNNEVLCVPRMVEEYIDYTDFLVNVQKNGVNHLIVNKKELIDALNRMSTINTLIDNCTDLYISDDKKFIDCMAKSDNSGEVKERLYISYDGNINKISFRTRELMSVLEHFNSSDITLRIIDDQGPCGFEGNKDSFYKVILMPVQTIETVYDEQITY